MKRSKGHTMSRRGKKRNKKKWKRRKLRKRLNCKGKLRERQFWP